MGCRLGRLDRLDRTPEPTVGPRSHSVPTALGDHPAAVSGDQHGVDADLCGEPADVPSEGEVEA